MAPERGARSLPCSTDGLPRAFLQSLRTLFDILDDRRRGSVHLREIESRWQGAEARELPPGVLEGLRQAAPASGYLTFEKFVLGLRASLLSPANGGTAARPAPGGCDPHGKARPAAPKGGPGRGPGEPRPLAEKGGYSSGLAGRSSRSMEKIPSPPGAPAHRAEGDRGGQSHGRRRAEANEGAGAGEGLPAPGAGDGGADLGMVPPADPDSAGAPETPGEKQNHKRLLPGGEPKPPGSPSTQAAGSEPLPQRAPVHLGEERLIPSPSQPLNSSSSALTRQVPAAPTLPPALAGPQQAISVLKEQNRLLTKEVTEKSERITQLEQEKSALIKQLFEARARNNHETSQLDSTFI
ncbi:suppressor APC domain-containing protein 2 isoform X2 [Dermochelys coriacea]|uniref:suppressor APC domain-containing protein 2 isoform X2 n=1 Tax=Dermochelys coriacea TaxID=27794 RepID=UPI0018E8D917|nr:suppressor APC domain-containing protein 2 isoform X2 [Dermochelys coriacea]